MKLAALLTALKAIPAAAGLVADVEKDLGHLPELDTKDLAAAAANATAAAERATKAEGQVKDLTASVKDLDAKAKGADALQAKVAAYEAAQRESVLGRAFTDAAKAAGVPDAAVATARQLADLSKVTVDLDKATVAGLTTDLFNELRMNHPVLFAAPAAGGQTPPPPAIPPLGQAGAGQTGAVQPEIPGAIGLFLKAGR
jgi:hypothetical protein